MGLIDEKDSKISIVNFLLMFTIMIGFAMMGYAICLNVKDVFIPLGTVLTAAVAGLGVKAHKGSS